MTPSDLVADYKRLMDQLPTEAGSRGLELLLRQMSPETADLLRLCGIPHHFDAEKMQVLAPGADSEWLQQKCAEFSELSFVVPNDNGWVIHDAARTYLFNSWLKPDQSLPFVRASARLVEYFQQVIDAGSGYSLVAATRANMFHLIGAEQAAGIERFVSLFRQARHQLNLSECEALTKLVHEYDPILDDESSQIVRYHDGKLAYDLRNWAQARRIFTALVEDDRLTTDIRGKAFNRLGMVYEALREWQAATNAYASALDLIGHDPEYSDLKARVYHNIAIVRRETNDLREAERLLQSSIQLHEQLGSYSSAATAYNSLGNLYRQLNDYKGAAQAYSQALDCLERSNDQFRTAQVYNNLGLLHADMAEWRESEKYFRQSLDMKRKAHDTLGQAKSLNNLMRVYQNLGEAEKAVDSAKTAIGLFKTVRDQFSLATVKVNLGRLYHSNGDDIQAKALLREAAETYSKLKETRLADATNEELSGLDETVGVPWWAWGALILVGLLVALFIVILVEYG